MNGKKNQLLILLSISLIISVAIAPVNSKLVSENTNDELLIDKENPFAPTNITEIQYCDTCHADETPDVFVTVTVDSQTTGDITYAVTGSDIYDGEEGWAVFDSLENNIKNGHNSGTFTLPKNGRDYRVYWVDNGTGGTGEAGGGSAYEDITTPNNPPFNPTISGETNGKTGQSYSYNFATTDPEEQDLFYQIKWGDGKTTDWFGPSGSGVSVSKSHTYDNDGSYTIEAQARDEYGKLSGWGTLKVTMPKGKSTGYSFNILNWLFEHFPNIFPILKYLI